MAEALRQGLISQSTSAVSAGLFFIEKKGAWLQPCIDYRGLNVVMVRYQHQLPLVLAVIDPLGGSTLFSNLDLRSAHNLV